MGECGSLEKKNHGRDMMRTALVDMGLLHIREYIGLIGVVVIVAGAFRSIY